MGQFLEYIKMAVDNIMSNKGRSILTMLGIIIGISSVITIVSLGNGMKSSVKEQNERNTQPITIEINSENTTNMELLTIEDLNAIENTLSSRIQYAYSTVYGDNAATETRKGKLTITTIFTVPEYNQATSTEETSIFRGKYFTEDDVTNAEPVAIIDKAGALAAFGTTDVVGMELEVTMNSMVQNVRIVGVRDASKEIMESMRMSNEMFGMGLSIQLEMPYTTAASFAKPINGFSSIMVKPQADQDKSAVTKIVLDLLQKRHLSDGENLFKQNNMMENMMNSMSSVIDMMTAFVAFVAGISLLVGGIGVMNIMLVSVTERTREIGIRKSLGAKTSSIITQFLCESAIISGIGGVIGIIWGIGLAQLIALMKIAGLTSKISIPSIIIATLFSCGVGIVFGIYPAQKAAKLSPIDALRQM